jgi:ribosomal protein S18 acetylase RimI-like enzyme
MAISTARIAPLLGSDRTAVTCKLAQYGGDSTVVRRGAVIDAAALPGFVVLAEAPGEWLGLVTYGISGRSCEIVTINSFQEGAGVGTALLGAVRRAAVSARCDHLWLITTNDNLDALRFFQKRGFRLNALYPDAVTHARRIKPELPEAGRGGIPLRDEIELVLALR